MKRINVAVDDSSLRTCCGAVDPENDNTHVFSINAGRNQHNTALLKTNDKMGGTESNEQPVWLSNHKVTIKSVLDTAISLTDSNCVGV